MVYAGKNATRYVWHYGGSVQMRPGWPPIGPFCPALDRREPQSPVKSTLLRTLALPSPRPCLTNLLVPVRRLQRRDHSQWLALRSCLWPKSPRERQIIEMTDILCQSRRKAVFVFDRGKGKLGGFLEITLRESLGDSSAPLVGYVEGWYVAPDLRRRGAGRALMSAAQRWTAQQGLTELTSCTEITNTGSIRAHRQLGFGESFRLVHFLMEIPRRTKRGKRLKT